MGSSTNTLSPCCSKMGELEESSPDIEVIVTILSAGKLKSSLEININKSRLVRELKQALSNIPEVAISACNMHLYTGETEMMDDLKILDYDIETDDEIFLEDLSAVL